MKYDDAKKRIRSGDLLAWTHRSWASLYDLEVQAVRFFTQSEYCHVGIAWVVGEGDDSRVFVLEAVKPKSRPWLLSQLGSFYHIPTDIPADVWEEKQQFALSLLGIKYSNLECITAFFRDTPPPGIDRMQCAKMAWLILRECGVHLVCKATPSAVVNAALERFDDLTLVT
jgi:hypothetical protein